jgi:aspartyl-tRNA(Asn)/glutamyl-tRNA(Gln) amidotransferase subunit C
MAINAKDVEHVAALARLKFNPEEVDVFTRQMSNILKYIEKLSELDTKGIVPTSHPFPMETPFREDEVKPSLPVDEALANAPDKARGLFRVPRVIE